MAYTSDVTDSFEKLFSSTPSVMPERQISVITWQLMLVPGSRSHGGGFCEFYMAAHSIRVRFTAPIGRSGVASLARRENDFAYESLTRNLKSLSAAADTQSVRRRRLVARHESFRIRTVGHDVAAFELRPEPINEGPTATRELRCNRIAQNVDGHRDAGANRQADDDCDQDADGEFSGSGEEFSSVHDVLAGTVFSDWVLSKSVHSHRWARKPSARAKRTFSWKIDALRSPGPPRKRLRPESRMNGRRSDRCISRVLRAIISVGMSPKAGALHG